MIFNVLLFKKSLDFAVANTGYFLLALIVLAGVVSPSFFRQQWPSIPKWRIFQSSNHTAKNSRIPEAALDDLEKIDTLDDSEDAAKYGHTSAGANGVGVDAYAEQRRERRERDLQELALRSGVHEKMVSDRHQLDGKARLSFGKNEWKKYYLRQHSWTLRDLKPYYAGGSLFKKLKRCVEEIRSRKMVSRLELMGLLSPYMNSFDELKERITYKERGDYVNKVNEDGPLDNEYFAFVRAAILISQDKDIPENTIIDDVLPK